MPKIPLSIVIPFVDLPHYVLDLVDTIKTNYDYRIILIDNNSSIDTKNELKCLLSNDKVIYIENDYNRGVASSWNQGINYAIEHFDSDYVAVLNNDILLHPQCLDWMIACSIGGFFPLVTAMDYAKECDFPHQILEKKIPLKSYIVDSPEFSCFLVNIKMLGKLAENENGCEDFPGRFDELFYPAYFEDNDFHLRLKLAKMRGVKTNQAMYYHYGSRTVRENPNMGQINSHYYLMNEERYINKWGGRPGDERFGSPFNSKDKKPCQKSIC